MGKKLIKVICKDCYGDCEYEQPTIGVLKSSCVLCGSICGIGDKEAVPLRTRTGTFFNLLKEGKLKSKIPTTLEECFPALDEMLSDNDKQMIKSMYDARSLHHGLGRHLRNKWGLWSGSPLHDWFVKKGKTHPDNMSSVILRSYQLRLQGKEFDIDEMLR